MLSINENIRDAFTGRPGLMAVRHSEGKNMQKLASFIGALALSSLLFSVTMV